MLSRVAARPVFVNDEVEKIKNADPYMINLGPGMSNFGAETFKLLRSNNLNQYAVQQRRLAADQAAKEEEKATLKYRQEFFD